jgi:hypothetical protein
MEDNTREFLVSPKVAFERALATGRGWASLILVPVDACVLPYNAVDNHDWKEEGWSVLRLVRVCYDYAALQGLKITDEGVYANIEKKGALHKTYVPWSAVVKVLAFDGCLCDDCWKSRSLH